MSVTRNNQREWKCPGCKTSSVRAAVIMNRDVCSDCLTKYQALKKSKLPQAAIEKTMFIKEMNAYVFNCCS